jgi:hypothetical protein
MYDYSGLLKSSLVRAVKMKASSRQYENTYCDPGIEMLIFYLTKVSCSFYIIAHEPTQITFM